MTIIMSSKPQMVRRVIKPTQSEMFKNLRFGSSIVFSMEVSPVGTGSKGRSYAPVVKVTCVETGETAFKTLNEVAKILERFEFFED